MVEATNGRSTPKSKRKYDRRLMSQALETASAASQTHDHRVRADLTDEACRLFRQAHQAAAREVLQQIRRDRR